jgi:hypothetical protein
MFSPTLYRYEQATASDTWVITHNIGNNGGQGLPIVDVFVDINGSMTKIIPMNVAKTSANIVTLTFSTAYAGFAVVIV